MNLRTVPIELEEANLFVERLHRHHPPVRGSPPASCHPGGDVRQACRR
jgi:hypothetical protein